MKDMKRLEVTATPLDGLNLIEANAGTGKTWTITALYLRLLLEAGCAVESILVVTFTEAATAELRDRIRKRVSDARLAFERGTAEEADVPVSALLERVADREQALRQLASALANFDQASIHTIHGFCQRVLADRAFESGMPFATAIVPDQSELLRDIVDDFWRGAFYGASRLFVRYALQEGLNPVALAEELKGRAGKPYLKIRAPGASPDLAALERAYEDAYVRARAIWREARSVVAAQLLGNPNLKANVYSGKVVSEGLEQLEAYLGPALPRIDLFKHFEKFTPKGLANGVKKDMPPPTHPFYAACQDLQRAHEALLAACGQRCAQLKAQLLEYANRELVARKRRSRLQSYDDLLLDLRNALAGEGGERLKHALRSRYTAALIDEFQDTDPVQYEIFRGIYEKTGLPVFLVGDPKQSIYSFRGADVFAYLEARREAARTRTLDVNWRSEARLLAAVNALFDRAAAPFAIGEIAFHPSLAAPGTRGALLIESGETAPLEIWRVDGAEGKPLTKDRAAVLAAEATAAEVARLLNLGARGEARIAEVGDGNTAVRNLAGGDIAVLVRTHDQARIMRDALRAVGVASVERGVENVFESHEAEELERVLLAVAEPGREALVRAAFATDLIGLPGAELHQACADDRRWEAMVETFRDFHREWRERGFIRMARAFLQRFDVMTRLLGYADGERRVTNVLHLVELLHRAAGRHGVGALMEWFAEKRKTPAKSNEEELLRLESDENLVKILTVHAAKGLEYPLVFCPFPWDGTRGARRGSAILFHDPQCGYKPVLEFGSGALAAQRAHAQREELAESLRLFYVALTRAKYRCWMVWGNIRDAGTSAPAWLLHRDAALGGSPATGNGPLDPIPLTDARIRADLENLAARAGGTVRVAPIPAGAGARFQPPGAAAAPVLSTRAFSGTVRDAWRITSFSGLTHGQAVEAPDYDAADRPFEAVAPAAARDIFAFPRGARAGKCLHAIFEQLDFTDMSRAPLEQLVARALSAHDFSATWTPVVADMVERVVATPLDQSATLRLAAVPAPARFNELEFHYPIAQLDDAALRGLLLGYGFPDEIRERIERLTFSPARGYMKGFIDLVFQAEGRFHLVDYKSNWLGAAQEDYGREALARAMAREGYYLQYLVYCVALHRYLQSRVPGYRYASHFGGVHYLFVRGMRPESGSTRGVYTDRPPVDLVAALDAYLRKGRPGPS